MALKGFDPRWKDFPDYILGITKEIWEDRGVATLHENYAENVILRGPAGIIETRQGIINNTLGTLSQFPDRQILGEDVIWSGSPEGRDLLSSHRVLVVMTHDQPGNYGQPTGRKLAVRTIADCAARDNLIYDEWLVRDVGAFVRQLGLEPKGYAADLIDREGGPDKCVKPFSPDNDVVGEYNGRGNKHPTGERYAELVTRIMAADLAAIPQCYDRACHLHLPGGVTGHGWPAADRFWLSLRAAFPYARLELHHQIGRDDPGLSPRAALRWSLTGKHEGWGMFGAPTGAEVHVMGLSHAEFGPSGLRREYVLIDEVAIWKQILMKTG